MTMNEAREELLEARRIMCSTRFGQPMLDTVIPTLGWLMFQVPEDMVSLVHATIYEAERRALYLPWGPPGGVK